MTDELAAGCCSAHREVLNIAANELLLTDMCDCESGVLGSDYASGRRWLSWGDL